jgi:hypothetical protein
VPKIIGTLLEIEQVRPRSFKRGDGELVELRGFPRLHVLEGRTVHEVDIDPDTFDGTLPAADKPVDVDVTVRAFNSKRGVQVIYDLVRINHNGTAHAVQPVGERKS